MIVGVLRCFTGATSDSRSRSRSGWWIFSNQSQINAARQRPPGKYFRGCHINGQYGTAAQIYVLNGQNLSLDLSHEMAETLVELIPGVVERFRR